MIKRLQRRWLLFFLGFLLVFATWAYGPSFIHPDEHLTFKLEGLLEDKLNFRDAGISINECLGEQRLRVGRLMRSSGFFSGWSCDRVGNPEVIYSLNYTAAEGRQYYCRGPDSAVIGRHFQSEEISDIELSENWDQKPDQTRHVCEIMNHIRQDFETGKRVLVHCDAGRDRTGAVIALLAAMDFEATSPLTEQEITAIECDYRKSQSLKAYKYGRVAAMLHYMKARGGVTNFLRAKCQWGG